MSDVKVITQVPAPTPPGAVPGNELPNNVIVWPSVNPVPGWTTSISVIVPASTVILNSKPLKPTKSCPVYLYEDNKAIVYPSTIVSADDIKMQYVKKPEDIRWRYTVGDIGQYIYLLTY